MSDIPIIFSAPMVLALLEGKKSMTRRLAWRDHHLAGLDFASEELESFDAQGWNVERCGNLYYVSKPMPWQRVKPGDRLWVRETFCAGDPALPSGVGIVPREEIARGMKVVYAASSDYGEDPPRWRSPIFMPRWASRLTLIVTATKIERLDQISEADAKAEGAIWHDGHGVGHSGWRHDCSHGCVHKDARTSFACLWDRLHGEGSFNACQEVVALSFSVHKSNIDHMAAGVEMVEVKSVSGEKNADHARS